MCNTKWKSLLPWLTVIILSCGTPELKFSLLPRWPSRGWGTFKEFRGRKQPDSTERMQPGHSDTIRMSRRHKYVNIHAPCFPIVYRCVWRCIATVWAIQNVSVLSLATMPKPVQIRALLCRTGGLPHLAVSVWLNIYIPSFGQSRFEFKEVSKLYHLT